MKEKDFTRLYCLLGCLCALSLLIIDEWPRHTEEPEKSIGESRRSLISSHSSCHSSSSLCSSLYFLSGVYDLVDLDIRFTLPLDESDSTTLFQRAAFSESALAKVRPFSAFDFFISTKTQQSSISGSVVLDQPSNGSAVVITSQFPGREMWFYSDNLRAPNCLNTSTSLVVFANALNDGLTLFTKTPEGACEKIDMEDSDTSPLTYCQAIGYMWHVFSDWKCTSEIITSEYISSGLGTVFYVVIGDNSSSAIAVLVSSSSFFQTVKNDQNRKEYPSFFNRKMELIVICLGSGGLFLLLVYYLSQWSKSSSAVTSFREGDIVIYRLTRLQLETIPPEKRNSETEPSKRKGLGLVVKMAPSQFLRGSPNFWSQKSVLHLQPLKKILRQGVSSAEKNETKSNNLESDTIELIVDEIEAPISPNWWGLSGGRVLEIIPPSCIHRRYILLDDEERKNTVKFSESSESNQENLSIDWLDSLESDALLIPKKSKSDSLRKRKGKISGVNPDPEEKIPPVQENSKFSLFWKKYITSGQEYSPVWTGGAGWSNENGEDGFFLLDSSKDIPQTPLPLFLKQSSEQYELLALQTKKTDRSNLKTGYSYLLRNLPPSTKEKINQVFLREWTYPVTKTGETKRERSSRSSSKLFKQQEPSKFVAPSIHPPINSPSPSRSTGLELKIKPAKSSQSEDLLNLLIKEQNDEISTPLPDISQFTASPQPVSVRIAMRRETSRKNRSTQMQSLSSAPAAVFTAPRVLSPLPILESAKSEEISNPTSPVQSYFVTPPRLSSLKSVKSNRHLGLDLHSQTDTKKKKPLSLVSPNSSPQLHPVSSSATPLPATHTNIIPPIDADREVNLGLGTVDKVVAGSKLEIDDEEEQVKPRIERQNSSRKSKAKIANPPSSTSPVLPPVISPRTLSLLEKGSPLTASFTASPKSFPLRNTFRKTLSDRKSGESERVLNTIEWEMEDIDEDSPALEKIGKPTIENRKSTKFDVNLNFLSDESASPPKKSLKKRQSTKFDMDLNFLNDDTVSPPEKIGKRPLKQRQTTKFDMDLNFLNDDTVSPPEKIGKRSLKQRQSTKFDMDLNFLNDLNDD